MQTVPCLEGDETPIINCLYQIVYIPKLIE